MAAQESEPVSMNVTPEVLARSHAHRSVGGHNCAHLSRTRSQLQQLKRKLLRAALEETPETGSFKRLCGAANQAAEVAWATPCPLLVFPCLFDEMVKAVRERYQQEQISDAQFPLTSLDADLRFEHIHSVSRGSDPISTEEVSLAA